MIKIANSNATSNLIQPIGGFSDNDPFSSSQECIWGEQIILSPTSQALIKEQTEMLNKRFSDLERLLQSEAKERKDSVSKEHRFTIKCTLICGLICAIVGAMAGFAFAQLPL